MYVYFCYLHNFMNAIKAPPKFALASAGEMTMKQIYTVFRDQYPDCVGVVAPLEGDMLKGAKTFLALQTRHARSVGIVSKSAHYDPGRNLLRTLPSAWTTSGANSIPNLCRNKHERAQQQYQ